MAGAVGPNRPVRVTDQGGVLSRIVNQGALVVGDGITLVSWPAGNNDGMVCPEVPNE